MANTTTVGLLVRLEAKPGKENEVAEFSPFCTANG